jgi:hypothetical protein
MNFLTASCQFHLISWQGIRALSIDKDNAPKVSSISLPLSDIQHFFFTYLFFWITLLPQYSGVQPPLKRWRVKTLNVFSNNSAQNMSSKSHLMIQTGDWTQNFLTIKFYISSLDNLLLQRHPYAGGMANTSRRSMQNLHSDHHITQQHPDHARHNGFGAWHACLIVRVLPVCNIIPSCWKLYKK